MTQFRFYSMDELDEMPDAELRDLGERVLAHRNGIRLARTARSAPDPFASTDVLVAMIQREQGWRNRGPESSRRGVGTDD